MSGLRGTTTARHAKKIIIREGAADGERISCAWDDCDNDAVQLYRILIDHGSKGHPYRTWYAFCSQRHLEYWRNGHRDYGNAR